MAVVEAFLAPASLAEAIEILEREAGSGTLVAGGTDLVVAARSGKAELPERLVSLHRLEELREIEELPDGSLRLGALVTHAQIEASPVIRRRQTALADAAALVGSPATRALGTLGGNLCNGSPAMEAGSPLLVADARVELVSARGQRTLPLGEFLLGPGLTARAEDELLAGVVLPDPGPGRLGSAYVRLEYRRAMEIAIVGAAATVVLGASGMCAAARVALTAVAPTCVRAPAAEAVLQGAEPSAETVAAAAAAAARDALPIGDVRASAEYRLEMVPVIALRAIGRALDRALEAA